METQTHGDGKSKGPGCVISDTRGSVGLHYMRRLHSLLGRTGVLFCLNPSLQFGMGSGICILSDGKAAGSLS